MRTAFYGRVSTDEDDQLNSLTNQITFFNDYIIGNGFEPVKCGILARKNGYKEVLEGGYADEGLSGKSLKKREAFKQMIKDAHQRKFDLIITKSVARFGRSVEDTAKTVKDLKELGVGVYFLDLQVNSLDNSKEFMINLFASLAQEESNSKSFNTQFGIRKAQKQGKFTGQAPYGYDLVDGYLSINEDEATIVKRIYDLYYNQAYGTGKIVRMLNQEGIKTKLGAKWSQIQASRILDNPIYKGLQIQHMSQTIDINRDIRKEIPEEDWIIHSFDHLIIIDSEFFDLVQIEKQCRLEKFGHISYQSNKYVNEDGEIQLVVTRKVKRNSGRHSNQHTLSNLLCCDNCGSSLKRKKRHAYKRVDGTTKDLGYEWSCTMNDMYGKDKCNQRNSLIENDILKHIERKIKDFRDNYNHSIMFESYLTNKLDTSKITEQINSLEIELTKTQKKVDLNFELLSDGEITKGEYSNRNTSLQEKLKEVKTELNRLRFADNEMDKMKIRFEEFLKILNGIDFNNLSNAVLRKIISKIRVSTPPSELEISLDKLVGGRSIEIEWLFIDEVYTNIFDPDYKKYVG